MEDGMDRSEWRSENWREEWRYEMAGGKWREKKKLIRVISGQRPRGWDGM